MAKWYGKIGFVETKETSPGIWTEDTIERPYYGDVIRNTFRWSQSTDSTNDNLKLSNQISIVADQFAYDNFRSMRYLEFMGARWKITDVDSSQRPRLILSMGDVYNGQ